MREIETALLAGWSYVVIGGIKVPLKPLDPFEIKEKAARKEANRLMKMLNS